MQDHQQIRHVLATLLKKGVSACEYAILGIIRLRIPLPPYEIASEAKYYDEHVYGNQYPIRPLDEYIDAIKDCLKKGWLTVLTANDIDNDPRLFGYGYYQPGSVDFTQEGFEFYRELRKQILRDEFVEEDDVLWDWNKEKQRLEIYAHSEEKCRDLVAEVINDPANCLGRPVRVTLLEPPVPIGPWKPNRFVTLSTGYHATLKVVLEQQ